MKWRSVQTLLYMGVNIMVDPKGCGCLIFLILMVALMITGVIGLFNFARSAAPVIISRLTEDIPTHQTVMFDELSEQYPILVEVPTEVRPGSDLVLTIRGAEYQDFSSPTIISFTISTEDLSFVRQIVPTITDTVASGEDWLLDPRDVLVSTVNLGKPPSQFTLRVTEIVVITCSQTKEFSGTISVSVDRTPVPSIRIAQGITSLLAFLIGTFGAFIASKLLGS